MADIARKTKRYPSDLTDEEWERMAPLMPAPGRRGRPREVEFREVINAVRYLVRSGCGWRMLPIHFAHWRTVYGWLRELALTNAEVRCRPFCALATVTWATVSTPHFISIAPAIPAADIHAIDQSIIVP